MALKTHALESRGHTPFCAVVLTEETIIIIHMDKQLHGLDTLAFTPFILTRPNWEGTLGLLSLSIYLIINIYQTQC